MATFRAVRCLRGFINRCQLVYNPCRTLSISAKKLTNSGEQINDSKEKKETHFGFETVSEDEKEEKVYEVFKNVAEKYDLMNDVMSGGIHRLWKDYFVSRLGPVPGSKCIDVAGGTGDIAFRILKYSINEAKDSPGFPNPLRSPDIKVPKGLQVDGATSSDSEGEEVTSRQSHVTVCDINQSMLDVGMRRAKALGLANQLSWVCTNAQHMDTIDDNTFDVYTIAYGIRNCTHIDKVLSEAYRVLKPGGRFMCLEFSRVNNTLLRWVYDEYSFQVIPVMGQVIAGDWHSYQYLVESIRQFPKQDDFKSMIEQAGFKLVNYENLFGGVTAIHSGFKLV